MLGRCKRLEDVLILVALHRGLHLGHALLELLDDLVVGAQGLLELHEVLLLRHSFFAQCSAQGLLQGLQVVHRDTGGLPVARGRRLRVVRGWPLLASSGSWLSPGRPTTSKRLLPIMARERTVDAEVVAEGAVELLSEVVAVELAPVAGWCGRRVLPLPLGGNRDAAQTRPDDIAARDTDTAHVAVGYHARGASPYLVCARLDLHNTARLDQLEAACHGHARACGNISKSASMDALLAILRAGGRSFTGQGSRPPRLKQHSSHISPRVATIQLKPDETVQSPQDSISWTSHKHWKEHRKRRRIPRGHRQLRHRDRAPKAHTRNN